MGSAYGNFQQFSVAVDKEGRERASENCGEITNQLTVLQQLSSPGVLGDSFEDKRMPDANTNLEKINEPVVSATEKKGKKPMVKPTLTKDDVIGKDHAENQNAVEQLADYEQAKTAL